MYSVYILYNIVIKRKLTYNCFCFFLILFFYLIQSLVNPLPLCIEDVHVRSHTYILDYHAKMWLESDSKIS